jgi:predicted cupin superfamily sugar epimerase
MNTADEIKAALGLKPLPREGGYYAETYRAAESLAGSALPGDFGGPRSLATAIYYLITPDTFSAMHRLRSDEVYHFYAGSPVEMLQLHPDGSVRTITLGPDIRGGMQVQTVVPRGVWQGSRLTCGEFALLGTTMAPGFDPADYEHGSREKLIQAFPEARDLITALTRDRQAGL